MLYSLCVWLRLQPYIGLNTPPRTDSRDGGAEGLQGGLSSLPPHQFQVKNKWIMKVAFSSFKISKFSRGGFPQNPLQVGVSVARSWAPPPNSKYAPPSLDSYITSTHLFRSCKHALSRLRSKTRLETRNLWNITHGESNFPANRACSERTNSKSSYSYPMQTQLLNNHY